MERGKVIIIPNENKILSDYYEKNIQKNHLEAFQDFSDKYQLGFHFTQDEYQEAPLKIAEQGHLSIKTIDDAGLFIIYIPRVITDRQINWFYQEKINIEKYTTIGGYAITEKEPIMVEGLDSITKMLNKKNMLYERKEDEFNVRKEI